jgi:hypothetical protein
MDIHEEGDGDYALTFSDTCTHMIFNAFFFCLLQEGLADLYCYTYLNFAILIHAVDLIVSTLFRPLHYALMLGFIFQQWKGGLVRYSRIFFKNTQES